MTPLEFVRAVARGSYFDNREHAHTITDDARHILRQLGEHAEALPADVAPRVSSDADENWSTNAIQFPRLITEIEAVLRPEDYAALAASMDLDAAALRELFDRAQAIWDDIKARTPGGA